MAFYDYDDYERERECCECESKDYQLEVARHNLETALRILYKDKTIDTEVLGDCLEEAFDAICYGLKDIGFFPKGKLQVERSKNSITALTELVTELNLSRAI